MPEFLRGNPVDHGLWTSDNAEERALAAALCHGCPIKVECSLAAEANGEKLAVWGGVDRTQPDGRHAEGTMVGNRG